MTIEGEFNRYLNEIGITRIEYKLESIQRIIRVLSNIKSNINYTKRLKKAKIIEKRIINYINKVDKNENGY